MKIPSYFLLSLILAMTSTLSAQTDNSDQESKQAPSQSPGQSSDQSPDQNPGPIKVEIIERNGKYQLLRGGEPYIVNGAGIDHADLESFAARGGNSFRTWAVDDGAMPPTELLDKAHALGLTVSFGLEFAPERSGFDYNDAEAVAAQAEATRKRVLAHRNHPALLTWFIGNELNYNYKNPKVYDAVNDIAKMIHELDPNHPVTTTLAGWDSKVVKMVEKRAPDLDFISIQLYADLINLPKYLDKANFNKPIFVTEWGATGHWEVGKTSWGAPVEQTSTEKARSYARGYLEVLRPLADQAVGNYVFLWGQKQERTPTWYGMFLETGESTEPVDIMYNIWNGQWPENRAPRVSVLALDGKTAFDSVTLRGGKTYKAAFTVQEPDGDPVSYRWEIRAESTATEVGGDREYVPQPIEGLIAEQNGNEIELIAPKEKGAYRLFVYVYDGKGHAGHANIPFYVRW